ARRSAASQGAAVLSSMPGVGRFTATSLACRVGRVERFPRVRSLANYWGLTPGCRNSGESEQRLGRITKAGSSMARWLLAQLVHKVLRRDARLPETRINATIRVRAQVVLNRFAKGAWTYWVFCGREPQSGRETPNWGQQGAER